MSFQNTREATAAGYVPAPNPSIQNPTVRRAVKLKFSLLALAKKQTDKRLRAHLNRLATLTRREFEGLSDNEMRFLLMEQFEEYSDGSTAQSLTVYDLYQLTGIPKKEVLRIAEKMIEKGLIVETDKIPDFHQYGDHGIRAFALNMDREKQKPKT